MKVFSLSLAKKINAKVSLFFVICPVFFCSVIIVNTF